MKDIFALEMLNHRGDVDSTSKFVVPGVRGVVWAVVTALSGRCRVERELNLTQLAEQVAVTA